MPATVTQSAQDAHARYEANRRGKPFTTKAAARPPASAKASLGASKPGRAAVAKAPRPAFAAVKRRIAAMSKPWLTGTEAGSVFRCSTRELLHITRYSLTPDLHSVGVAKRFSSEELLSWAAGGFMFGQPGDTPLAQRQARFIEKVARDESAKPSKKRTARIAASHAARTAAFSR